MRCSAISALRTNADSANASSGRSAARHSVGLSAKGSARSASMLFGSSSVQTGSTPPGQSDISSIAPALPGRPWRSSPGSACSSCQPRFTASLSRFSALNDGDFEAGIGTLSPVRGFLPVRATRLRVPKVPNPAIRTPSSFASPSAIASKTVSTAPSAVNLFRPIRAATRATIADLFISPLPPIPRRGAFAIRPCRIRISLSWRGRGRIPSHSAS